MRANSKSEHVSIPLEGSGLLQLALFDFLEALFQRLEFFARACEHGLLNFELLSRNEIELAKPALQYGAEVFLQFLADGTQSLGHRLSEFSREIFY